MISSLSLLIGRRFRRGRSRVGMVSLISAISTIGIALGVMALIVGLSAMNGFERELRNRVLSVFPHGEIVPLNQPFLNWNTAIERITQTPGIVAASPYVSFTGLIEHGEKFQALHVRGVDPEKETKQSSLPEFMDKHNWEKFTNGSKQIILGSGIADSLKIRVGEWVTILIPDDNNKNILQPKRIRLRVLGILRLSGVLDRTLALIPLADAQKYLNIGTSVSGIAVRMLNPFVAKSLIRTAGERSGVDAHISTWIGSYGNMYRDIQMIRTIIYLAMVLVMSVSSFSIASTLVMAVKDKSSDISVLKTLGAGDKLIRAIFIWYGVFASFTGSVCGMVAGVLISLNMASLAKGIEFLTGNKFLSGNVYFVDFIPSEVHWRDVIYVMAAAIILSLIASWYPSRRAAQLNPAQVLSGR